MLNSNQSFANTHPQWRRDIRIVELDMLRQHEEVDPMHLFRLKGEIELDGVLKFAIAVDADTNIILDGQHRVDALRRLSCTRVPVVFINYSSPEIVVHAWRRAEAYSKEDVRRAGFSQEKFPPTTTKHMIRICSRLWHISAIEDRVDIPLEKLRGENGACC